MEYAKDVVIVGGVRTAHGRFKGALFETSAVDLGAMAIKATLEQTGVDSSTIDEVIMGNVLSAGIGQHPARQAAINAGINISKPAHIVNQVCGSGLRAVISGFQSIKLGEVKNVISGGQENMSLAPHSIFTGIVKKF